MNTRKNKAEIALHVSKGTGFKVNISKSNARQE
jgi:hypothetical protein